jgi:hypothetical protein
MSSRMISAGKAFAVLLATTLGCHVGLVGVLAGSATKHGPYRGNELITELGPDSVRTLGCIDIGFRVQHREEKGEHLDVHFGNRCAHPEAVDLKKASLTAFDLDGNPVGVSLSDPRNEIAELHVGAAERGEEIVRLDKAEAKPLGRICFDLKMVAPDAPDARPDPFCIERSRFVFRSAKPWSS